MTDTIPRTTNLGHGTPPVCRLGLASRGNTHLSAADVRLAIDKGVNYLNWCKHRDGMSRAVSEMTSEQRERVVVALQFYTRTAHDAEKELSNVLSMLRTDYVDIVTFYYVESPSEWNEITGPGGTMEYLQEVKREGKIRLVGLTTHQRALGAEWIKTGLLDLLMIRFNAAHTGAETEVFPITRELGIPVIVFTCMRWGAVLEPTPEDPADFEPPKAPQWYRFALCNPEVSVVLMAPNDRRELVENLSIIESWEPLDPESVRLLREHGQRVKKYAGSFP